jgi:hypothetical protein
MSCAVARPKRGVCQGGTVSILLRGAGFGTAGGRGFPVGQRPGHVAHGSTRTSLSGSDHLSVDGLTECLNPVFA